MARRNKLYNLILGLIIGVCISLLAKRGRDTCSTTMSMSYIAASQDPAVEDQTTQNTHEGLLFVGVMTAAKYLETRAIAAYHTWGQSVPGRIAFFSSEESRSDNLPLISLIGVDDSYPPQKKSFTMLKYMHDNYLERYEWFMRADDDVYIRTDRLSALLRSVDSRKPWFIGQTGRGNSEEFGLLSLESDENFCMGGPGIVLSRETLRRIGPHIEECLANLYTTHEDVELGRCVRRSAGVSCTWSYEMQVILYHNQSGSASFSGNLKQKEVHKAITLHPIKDAKYMYRLHKYFKGLRIQAGKQESIRLHRDVAMAVAQMDQHAGRGDGQLDGVMLADDVRLFEATIGSDLYLGDPNLLGIKNGLNRFRATNLRDVLDWEFISKSIYSYRDLNPKRRLGSTMKEGLDDAVRDVMDIINLYSKQRGRVIDFKEIFYGYWRLDPVHGVDLILDLLLVYKKYRGHKMTVQVRRHAYIQQTFTGIEIREIANKPDNPASPNNNNLFHDVISKLSQNIPTIFTARNDNTPIINLLVPLSGRYDTFKRFLTNYEEVCLSSNHHRTKLIIILYQHEDFLRTMRLINSTRVRYAKNAELVVRVVDGKVFSRGRALKYGVDLLQNQDLMFFVDVDVIFTRASLERVRMNTQLGRSVYFPIVFSMYNTKFVNETCGECISDKFGTWRQFGFGLASLYKYDYTNLGGFNTSITGWGFEDVNFYDKIIQSSLKIIRSVDPGLTHIYHPVICDRNLESSQFQMCLGTKASMFASLKQLQNYYHQFKYLLL